MMTETAPDWMTAHEAAHLLASRNMDPIIELGRLISETGEYGAGRVWMLAQAPLRYRGQWILEPEIDISSGTIVAPMQIGRRRISEFQAVPFLLNRREIDRRWPEHPAAYRQKTTTAQREELEATTYFINTMIPRGRARRDGAWTELKAKFPGLSERHFKTVIWKGNAPADWRSAGPPRKSERH